jgi:hypothetical protein
MKFKTLFLSMLVAVAIVSCNNDSVINPGPVGGGGEENGQEETTYATFLLKAGVPSASTYAGDANVTGSTGESRVTNAVLAIYKSSTGEPEAVAYVNAVPQGTNATTGSGGKITLKCKTGAKKIFLAVNVGAPVTTVPTATASPILVYGGTDKTVDNTNANPGVTEKYEGAAGTVFADTLNALLVVTDDATYMNDFQNKSVNTASSTWPAENKKVDGLIRALTGGGSSATTGNGVLKGEGTNTSAYLMSNWEGGPDVASGSTNAATYQFNLKKVTAAVSRMAIAEEPNANAFNINVQRAVAKIALNVKPIASADSAAAGSGTNAGVVDLTLSPKFAVGNIAKATYPFQQFDGSVVKSAAYNCTEGIIGGATSQFARFMDNTRIFGTYDFTGTKPTVDAIVANIKGDPNIAFKKLATPAFAADDYIIVTENNNASASNAYSTYVVFAATYKPGNDNIITAAPAGSTDATCLKTGGLGGQPTYTANGTQTDTLYYVKDANFASLAGGKFFWGVNTLRDYMANVLGIPAVDLQKQVEDWSKITGTEQAKLQRYYQGQCFYRIWVKDSSAAQSADKFLVRRNHIYEINVNEFKGPGIADPYSIIDPDPATGPEELEESDTYVTTTINVVPWHKVTQTEPGGLD